jgi:hypothetical protein
MVIGLPLAVIGTFSKVKPLLELAVYRRLLATGECTGMLAADVLLRRVKFACADQLKLAGWQGSDGRRAIHPVLTRYLPLKQSPWCRGSQATRIDTGSPLATRSRRWSRHSPGRVRHPR